MSEYMIEAHNLHRRYGAKEAVNGISFQIQQGEIFGLLGPNGAGKTTTIRMLTGQIDPNSGWAKVAGYDILKERQPLKKHIGVVFEEQNLYERLSARQNLEFCCWLYQISTSRVDEVLELVQLRDRAKEPIQKFSNGMRQRIMIARALLHKPQVLFLDEPSRGLDLIAANQIQQTIKDLSSEGITILLTSHIMEEVDRLCQRVAFIVNGALAASDTPRNLKLAHGDRTLTVTLNDTLDNPNESASQISDKILNMDAINDRTQLTQWISKGVVKAIHTNEATLEEVFLKVAGTHLTESIQ